MSASTAASADRFRVRIHRVLTSATFDGTGARLAELLGRAQREGHQPQHYLEYRRLAGLHREILGILVDWNEMPPSARRRLMTDPVVAAFVGGMQEITQVAPKRILN